MESKQHRTEPFNWSNYDRTYNNAIDLVAQCIGYHRSACKPLRAIYLKPASYHLFVAGLRLLMAKQGKLFDEKADIFFDGVKILHGNSRQFDTIKCEYYEQVQN